MMDGLSEKAAGLRSLFSYSNLVHAISGATGSVIAISVFYPLDTVRTRLQVDDHRCAKNTFHVLREIIQEEGFLGLYRGWQSMAVTTFLSSFVYFYTYACLQYFSAVGVQAFPTHPLPSTMTLDLLIAFMAGVVNVLVTTPLWVANTRLKLQGAKLHTAHYNKKDGPNKSQYCRYKGIVDCILKIIRSEGVKKLWGGTVASLLLATNPAIQFMIYEALKRYFKRFFNVAELSGLMYFILGAIAKASATVITYPLQVVQSRLRAGYAKVESSQTLRQNIIHLVKKNGLGALYKGMEAKLLQTILTAALMFVIYEKVAALIFRLMGIASK
ncbi:peroxisomal membrane protein PMP34-like isoform X1 [Physella acuta]|uniref:peroxisomal membrane protein PMP34-like isoform X1 n=1 Tax=Physella acuta TaxID=109671 RepID=UPI0027DADF58|nr:peroxisomal membrane protein PMP34-like isoform X1 [Physella acuta]